MRIMAFGHRKQVGKSTACKFLVSHLKLNTKGQRITSIGFATALYDICYTLYGWAGFMDENYYEGHPQEKEKILHILGKTPRQILIDVGTSVFREVYQGTWVDYLAHKTNYDYLAIKDMRFENEFSTVKAVGGYCVRIDRPSIPHTDDIADIGLAHLPDSAWDAVIVNNGSLNDLHANVIQLSRRFLNI